MTRHELVIGLLWHSINSGNLGVGALTLSHIAIFEKLAREIGVSTKFVVLGWNDHHRPYVTGDNIEAVPLRARHFMPGPGGLHAAARRCDLVCDISAGDSFADIYGLRRFGFQALSKIIVLGANLPLILAPQTIGPFKHRTTRIIADRIIERCKVVTVRDEHSLNRLNPAGKQRTILATDVAFRLPYERMDHGNNYKHVGLNVSGLLFNGGYNGHNMFGLKSDYRKLVCAMLGQFADRKDCKVHLISHVISEDNAIEDDYRVSSRLANAFQNVFVAPRFSGPTEAKSYIAGLDFMLGSRMHACIAALSAGVPVMPLAYSPKFEGLFASLGYHDFADCQTETASAIVEKAVHAFENRNKLRANAEAARQQADLRLAAYESALRENLIEAALGRTGSCPNLRH